MRVSQIFGAETEYGLYKSQTLSAKKQSISSLFNQKMVSDLQFTKTPNSFCFWLTNGGRFHLDNHSEEDHNPNATPEYDTPETGSAIDLVRWEKAGDLIVSRIFDLTDRNKENILLVKHCRGRNFVKARRWIDATSGHHENYSVDLSHERYLKEFAVKSGDVSSVADDYPKKSRSAERLIAFLVSRIILHGAGWFQSKIIAAVPFQLSPRADFISHIFNPTTTENRAILCTAKDGESHAGSHTQRMHLLLGDLNMAEPSIYLTAGTTALVLRMLLESDLLEDAPILKHPVAALHAFSWDPFLQTAVEVQNSRKKLATALELQEYFCLKGQEFIIQHESSSDEKGLVKYWADCLARLKDCIYNLDGELDWVTKFCLLRAYLGQHNSTWKDVVNGKEIKIAAKGELKKVALASRCRGLDLAYHNIADDGIYNRLAKAGKMKKLVSDEEIKEAVLKPPQNTRAKVRSEIVSWAKKEKKVGVLNWSEVSLFAAPPQARVIKLLDPFDFFGEEWQAFLAGYNFDKNKGGR